MLYPPEPAPPLLIAEDNHDNRTLFVDYFSAKGYRVIAAPHGQEAVELAASSRPAIIVMDIQMPGLDGLEAIRQIRAIPALRATPIIALTALAMSGDRERCLDAGANAYLTKPASMRALRELIESLLRGESQA
ncbi:MAG: hypothetical protein OHK0015_27030 [Chloroflexi bacterium OHK40]